MSIGPRILVIDDEPEMLELLREGLGSYDYQVVTANNGKEGLTKFTEGNFDLVLCDLVMPDLSGTQVLERILSVDEAVPVLMITGHPTIETAVNAMAQGAYDYVTKPFSFDDLDLRIKRCLDAKFSNERAKSAKAFSIILLLSIPFWIILGLAIAFFIR
jgi:DNA-binding NtrC family response regulator